MHRLAKLKDPGAVLDYSVDWAGGGYLGQVPDQRSVMGSSWTVEPVEAGGLTVSSQSLASNIATCIISGGIVGHIYTLTNRATISDGTTDERSILIRIEER